MRAATDMTDENDVMTQASERFLEQEVKDEKLREILKPHSKCKCPSTNVPFPTSFLSPIDRLLQTPSTFRQFLQLSCQEELHCFERALAAVYRARRPFPRCGYQEAE